LIINNALYDLGFDKIAQTYYKTQLFSGLAVALALLDAVWWLPAEFHGIM
jgi:hypothetical protein